MTTSLISGLSPERRVRWILSRRRRPPLMGKTGESAPLARILYSAARSRICYSPRTRPIPPPRRAIPTRGSVGEGLWEGIATGGAPEPGARRVDRDLGQSRKKQRFEYTWCVAGKGAEACGSRTHPSRSSRDADGFEVREGHRAPCASATDYVSGSGDGARSSHIQLPSRQAPPRETAPRAVPRAPAAPTPVASAAPLAPPPVASLKRGAATR